MHGVHYCSAAAKPTEDRNHFHWVARPDLVESPENSSTNCKKAQGQDTAFPPLLRKDEPGNSPKVSTVTRSLIERIEEKLLIINGSLGS